MRVRRTSNRSTKAMSLAVLAMVLCVSSAAFAGPINVVNTSSSAALVAALPGSGGLTVNSATVTNGATTQFGTFSNFNLLPGGGVVLSSGLALQTTPAFHSTGSSPSSSGLAAGTAEFNAYGPGHITNFSASFDVAALEFNFTLASASQVGFDFVFGSVEFPVFTNSFTDAFLAFLDGTGSANQIAFSATNQAVQVNSTFASALTTANTETAFFDPHGLLFLTTFTTGQLSAGAHTLRFEVGDVNDGQLDSAAFISNLRAGTGPGGTNPPGVVPEPTTCLLVGTGVVAMLRRRSAK